MNEEEIVAIKIKTPILDMVDSRASICGMTSEEYMKNIIEQSMLSEKW